MGESFGFRVLHVKPGYLRQRLWPSRQSPRVSSFEARTMPLMASPDQQSNYEKVSFHLAFATDAIEGAGVELERMPVNADIVQLNTFAL